MFSNLTIKFYRIALKDNTKNKNMTRFDNKYLLADNKGVKLPVSLTSFVNKTIVTLT